MAVEKAPGRGSRRSEDCSPRADALIHSIRAFGYGLPMAIADLIDNSITAGSRKVSINYKWDGPRSWVYILDDGMGMTESQLREAMRLGSQSPLDERSPEDLGRFGLGLKTASFSQCKVLTVRTRRPDGSTATRSWDLDHVRETGEWALDVDAPETASSILADLDEQEHGTIVLWQDLDRILDSGDRDPEEMKRAFLGRFSGEVIQYLEMVFHRFLEDRSLSIDAGLQELEPWDPYLRRNNHTQELSDEGFADGRVRVVPYVLPHVSKRTLEENERGSGIKGWNAQQGFYLYRNRRMILSGGYLDLSLKPEEHFKLARIMVDIPNNMDHEWSIDVRKAYARPPDHLRGEFQRIARATRSRAVRVYRERTGRPRSTGAKKNTHDIWVRRLKGEKVVYQLNSESEVLKKILEELDPSSSWVRKLFHVIETTVPYRPIIIDNNENEDCHVNLPLEATKPPKELLELCRFMFRKKVEGGCSAEEAVEVLAGIEPYNSHPAYRAMLDELRMEEDR